MEITKEQIKQMQADGVGLIPVIKLVREKHGCGLAEAKRLCDSVGGKWIRIDEPGSRTPDYKGVNSETFQKIKVEMPSRLWKTSDRNEELKNIIRELLAWAESVEGHEVMRNITKGKDSIFEQARELLRK